MNQQQIFDVVVMHAINQHSKALTNMDRCNYLAEDGTKCFVGILIPKEDYLDTMENKGVDYLLQENRTLIPFVVPSDMAYHLGISFLESLQQIHDTILIIFWGEELRKVATKYGLKFMQEED